MLTSISPLGERGRHNRWSTTVMWYLIASTVVAAAIGAGLGEIGAALGLPAPVRAVAWIILAVATVLADAHRLPLPTWRRQVNEDWLGRYRGWAYGAGFGAQLGAGVVTIVTTAAVYLTMAAEVAAGSPLAGAVIGAAFGLARGVPILGGAGAYSFSVLMSRHRRLMEMESPARQATMAMIALGAVGLLVTVIGRWR